MVSFQRVKYFLRPWGWLRSLRRIPSREGILRPRWRGWTPGVVLQHRFKWGPSTPGLKLRFLAPHRASFRVEVPALAGGGLFRHSNHFFRRRRQFRRYRRRIKYRILFLAPQTKIPLFPPRTGGLPPRGYRQHFNFWAPRRGTRRRGLPFQMDRVVSPRRARRRRRKMYHARPGGLAFSFRQDYLRGISTLFNFTPRGSIFRTPPSNRLNHTVRLGRVISYLVPPRMNLRLVPSRVKFRFSSSSAPGWPTPRRRKVRPRRGGMVFQDLPSPEIENILEGVAHLQGARYQYRLGRTGRIPRRRRRTALVTRDERRGWFFRRPHPRRRNQSFFELSPFLARRVHRARRFRRAHRKHLTYRKRCRTNRVRHLRRRRKLRVPRRMWKFFRRISRRPRRIWKSLRVGPHGVNQRRGKFYQIFPFLRTPWRSRRRFRSRLQTPRKIQLFRLRQRRNRQIPRLSWVGARGVLRRVQSTRRYLRRRGRQLLRLRRRSRRSILRLRRRSRRGRRNRGSSRGWLKARGFARSDYPTSYHLGRWFGLFTRRGRTFPREGREILRAIPVGGVTQLYHLFASPLGARSRRRGGALLKVPTLLETRQAWSQVRRWFVKGVSTRGDRGWPQRVAQEILTPVGVARGREEFIRAALFNRALL